MFKKRSFAFRSFRTQRVTFFLFIFLIGFQIFLDHFELQNDSIDILAFDAVLQEQIDSLKQQQKAGIFPFNPNYISLSKGYQLELSLEEIERLHEYRDSGKFINSAKEFETVTQVNSSWIEKYSSFFKFPKWVTTQKEQVLEPKIKLLKDLNIATASDLTKVRGIGQVFSNRIIKYRTLLQGFDNLDQLHEVYGLDSSMVSEIKLQFKIKTKLERTKIAISKATLEELLRIPYLNKTEAKKIVGLRTRNPNLTLKNIHAELSFDSLKIERLALYLY